MPRASNQETARKRKLAREMERRRSDSAARVVTPDETILLMAKTIAARQLSLMNSALDSGEALDLNAARALDSIMGALTKVKALETSKTDEAAMAAMSDAELEAELGREEVREAKVAEAVKKALSKGD